MMISIDDPLKGMEKLYDRFVSKEWWIIWESVNDDSVIDRIQNIEIKYFLGDKNMNFEIMAFPDLTHAILLKKTRITKEQLCTELEIEIPDGNHDVFFLVDNYTNQIREEFFNSMKAIRQARSCF